MGVFELEKGRDDTLLCVSFAVDSAFGEEPMRPSAAPSFGLEEMPAW